MDASYVIVKKGLEEIVVGGVNLAVWTWMAIYAFLLYTVVFFLYSKVTMTVRQVIFFIPAIFVWTVIETYFTCMPSSQFQIIMCNFFELSWLLPTVYLFTESFSLSLMRFSVVSWIANSISLFVMNIYDHKDCLLFSQKRLNEISWKSVAVFTLSVIVVILLEYPLIKKFLPYKSHLVGKYRAAACLYLIFLAVDLIIEIIAATDGKYIWRGTFKGLFAICLTVLIVLLAVLAKRRSLVAHKQHLESRIELLNSEYEKIVEKNRELHKIRHELNKQAEAFRVTKGYVPEKIRLNMIEEAGSKAQKVLSEMSLSGNLMIDTLLEQKRSQLDRQGITFETVLTPIRFSKSVEDDVVVVQEEMFFFAERFYENCKSIRYSIRVKNRSLFIIMEIEFESTTPYKRQKLIDVIGDRMVFRQAFNRTNSMLERCDGSMDYELGKNGVVLGVMMVFC